MKKDLRTVLIMGMVVLSIHTFGQTNTADFSNAKEDKKSANTYLDLMVNIVSTNLNYGASNSVLADYKQSIHGVQAGASFQAGITPAFSLVSEIYYMRKGGKLKAGNPLTINESTLRLNTLELPVLARFHVGKFYMNAGPSIAYNLSGNRKSE